MFDLPHLIPDDDGYAAAIDVDDLRERASTAWMTALARYTGHYSGYMPTRFDLTDKYAYCWLPRYGVVECNQIVYVKGNYVMTYKWGNFQSRDSYRLVHVRNVVATDEWHADTVFGEPEPEIRRTDGSGREYWERVAA